VNKALALVADPAVRLYQKWPGTGATSVGSQPVPSLFLRGRLSGYRAVITQLILEMTRTRKLKAAGTTTIYVQRLNDKIDRIGKSN